MEQNRTTNYKFREHEAVVWNGQMARIEDTAVDVTGRNIYLIQTAQHRYHYVYEEDLEVYIG